MISCETKLLKVCKIANVVVIRSGSVNRDCLDGEKINLYW